MSNINVHKSVEHHLLAVISSGLRCSLFGFTLFVVRCSVSVVWCSLFGRCCAVGPFIIVGDLISSIVSQDSA